MFASKLKIHSRYDLPPSPSLEFKDASLTRQEFASDSDLNNIMRKYAAGLASLPSGTRTPLFGDFSNIPDYQESVALIQDAEERFMQLPSAVRERFDNDPGVLLGFLADSKNREEAVKLGLVSAPPLDKVDPPADSAEPGETK